MIKEKLRVFRLLLYKCYLVRKRHWKGSLIQIFIPLLMFYAVCRLRIEMKLEPITYPNTSYPVEDVQRLFAGIPGHLYIVPDNPFIGKFMETFKKCLKYEIPMEKFKTEEDMVKAYLNRNITTPVIAVVFKNKLIDLNTSIFEYKLRVQTTLPDPSIMNENPDMEDIFHQGFAGIQLCLDTTFISMKHRVKDFNLDIDTQRMPLVAHTEAGAINKVFATFFCTFATIAFLIPLSMETSNASKERFLGINVLMSMNGVPNYLNLLSWLASGLSFGLLYIVPIVILLGYPFDDGIPFLYYGNSLTVWFVLILHLAHLICFGMHLSSYFTKSMFLDIGLIVLYMGSNSLKERFIKEEYYPIVPFLGIIFPNFLLDRAFNEINSYESAKQGTHLSNLFRVADVSYKNQGSLGMMIVFSIVGIIIHFIMANYINAIYPGKYGTGKSPFYFLKFLKKMKGSKDYNKVENLDFNDNNGKPFEPVTEGTYTPGIQIRNLVKTYDSGVFNKMNVYALRGVSVDFYQGQVTSLLGHNGAGKTTMMSILTGMISPTDGIVLVNGKNVKEDADGIMKEVGLCPQENMLFPTLSVVEQLTFFAMLKSKNKPNHVIQSEVTSFLQKLKLFEKRNTLPKHLSGGQKRRVCFGMAIVGGANTIILDEPTSGLDPESKRDIWDIILKLRGEKTILISTHDMEEADILGDRIAIMHTGKLRCYGTSMFLKKLLGQGNVEVTLSTESWCNPEKVRSFLGSQSEISSTDVGKIVLSSPLTQQLPDSLDAMESNKKSLGVTGMSVSIITLEQVFLKVTQENDSTDSQQLLISNPEKLEGRKLFIQSVKALLKKKLTYTQKNIASTIIILLLFVPPFLFTPKILETNISTKAPDEIPINLAMYYNPKTFYRDDDASVPYGRNYKQITEVYQGQTIDILKKGQNVEYELIKYGMKNDLDYEYRLTSGGDFNPSFNNLHVRAFYNPQKAFYALPISLNLVTNVVAKTLLGEDHDIILSGQKLPEKVTGDPVELLVFFSIFNPYFAALSIIVFLYTAVALFVIHPLKENITNIKHLQRMSGVSYFNYWGTMFIFDFILFFFLTMLLIISFIIQDKLFNLRYLHATEVVILITLFLLFAINVFPVVYIFSFFKKSTGTTIKLLTMIPMGLVTAEMIMIVITQIIGNNSRTINILRPIQKVIFLLTPYISFLHGKISFFQTMKKNRDCSVWSETFEPSRLCNQIITYCCGMNCSNGTCENPKNYFDDFKEDVSLETSILSLCLTPILYFGLLFILEYKLIQATIVRFFGSKPGSIDRDFEEQVKEVKNNIAFEINKIRNRNAGTIRTNSDLQIFGNSSDLDLSGNNEAQDHFFLVYELRKRYGNLVAVQDISFGVKQGECFGLLGVNGAGKSTTFRMMIGQEIPDNGTLILGGKDMKHSQQSYLSQMGYCPQNDAIITSLNAYDHLSLFARLRGIPNELVQTEVNQWIKNLNLNACASQPSGTYSGGNKRRLNIAIALIGNPNIILMDEPTTGVDPAARRSLWNVIQFCQASGQAVVFTSHSMEECEALCNRLAIMVNGKLVCIGPSQELKQRFGAGYDIQLKLNPEKSKEQIAGIKTDITKALNCECIDENSSYLMYHVPSMETKWRQMYNVINELKDKYSCIEDFSVLSSTLEQLFLLFARAAVENK